MNLPNKIICKEQMIFMDKNVYDVHVEFINAKSCMLQIESKIIGHIQSDNVQKQMKRTFL